MCNPEINEPLGCPAGSVRSILALIIIPTIISLAGAAMIIMFIRGENENALGILSGLTGILGTVVGYYFASRSSATASKAITDMAHENMENMKLELDIKNTKVHNLKRVIDRDDHNDFRNNDFRINMNDDEVEEINSGLL